MGRRQALCKAGGFRESCTLLYDPIAWFDRSGLSSQQMLGIGNLGRNYGNRKRDSLARLVIQRQLYKYLINKVTSLGEAQH
jgi:hypothetical protein